MAEDLKTRLLYVKQTMGEGAHSNLVRALVDRAIRKAVENGEIPHYRYGPAYMQTYEKWLWKQYINN